LSKPKLKQNKITPKSKEIPINQDQSSNKDPLLIPKVGIIMGSDSDLQIMTEAAKVLKEFDIPFEIRIVSAHRTPKELFEYAESAESNGIQVIISGAGGAAHLPGMVASLTPLPVIGVPIRSPTNPIRGLDSLYSIVQMPPGVPVATVSINGARNAGILACSILSLADSLLLDRIRIYKEKMREEIRRKNKRLAEVGHDNYIKKYLKTLTTK
jgi:phosphoribosylaminoimidazole carboxylase PurE protein